MSSDVVIINFRGASFLFNEGLSIIRLCSSYLNCLCQVVLSSVLFERLKVSCETKVESCLDCRNPVKQMKFSINRVIVLAFIYSKYHMWNGIRIFGVRFSV